MPWWIHCNICFSVYNPKAKFFVLDCRHITCDKCLKFKEGRKTKCPKCKATAEVTPLNGGKLPPEMEVFFQPIQDALNQVQFVTNFQQHNIHNWTNCMMMKYQQAKTRFAEMHNCYQQEHKKLEMLEERYRKLQINDTACHKTTHSDRRHPAQHPVQSFGYPGIPQDSRFVNDGAASSIGSNFWGPPEDKKQKSSCGKQFPTRR